MHGALRNTERLFFMVLKSYENMYASTARLNKIAEATDLNIIKIHVEASFNIVVLSTTVHKYEKEKPSVKPFASAMDDEAKKQKYVNPEMNMRKRYPISISETTSTVISFSENVSHPTKMPLKCPYIIPKSTADLSTYDE